MIFIEKALRALFALVDGIAAWAVGILYKLIVQIANVDIFGDYIFEFMGRIYAFLAIFMLFKLSISVVNYVLNPDQMVDKSKGFGKLIQNVIIVIALIIFVPTIFDWAYKLQSLILNTNVLYTIVTGERNTSTYNIINNSNASDEEIIKALNDDADNAASMIKYQLLSTFIYKDLEIDSDGNGIKEQVTFAVGDNKNTYEYSCHAKFIAETTDDFNVEFYRGEEGSKYPEGPDYEKAVDCLLSTKTINNTSGSGTKYGFNENFTNEYRFLISTLCIGAAAYIFLVFCFDVALRCVRLGVLQLIAPIPIMSMLDPQSGKSGMFSKWLKDCTTTYISLFIRLVGVYFAIEIIKTITVPGRMVWRGTTTGVSFFEYPFVKVFIILGLLMFAKQLPQFIESLIPGLKLESGGLNLKKKIDSVPGMKKTLGGAKGLATGALIGGIGAATGAGIGRGFTGAWQGLRAGMQGKKFGEIRKQQVDANNKMRKAILDGSTFGGRMGRRVTNFLGNEGTIEQIAREKHDLQDLIREQEDERKRIEAQISPVRREISNKKSVSDSIKQIQDRATSKIKQGDGSAESNHYKQLLIDAAGFESTGNGAMAERLRQEAETYANTVGRDSWINRKVHDTDSDGRIKDTVVRDMVDTYNLNAGIADETTIDITSSDFAETLDSQGKEVNSKIVQSQNDIAQREQEIVGIDDTIKDYNSRMTDINNRENIANANNSAVN